METFQLELWKDFVIFQNVDSINGIRDIILLLFSLMNIKSTDIRDKDYVYPSEN